MRHKVPPYDKLGIFTTENGLIWTIRARLSENATSKSRIYLSVDEIILTEEGALPEDLNVIRMDEEPGQQFERIRKANMKAVQWAKPFVVKALETMFGELSDGQKYEVGWSANAGCRCSPGYICPQVTGWNIWVQAVKGC